MGNENFIIVPRQITVGTSYGTYSTISNEAMKQKYHGDNTTGKGVGNLNPANGKVRDEFVLTDSNTNCVLYKGYSDEDSSSIHIYNRRGESVNYFGEEKTTGSYERKMTRLEVTYLKPDGTFNHQQAVDKNNNGVVDEGEILDFNW